MDESSLDPDGSGEWRHASSARYRECLPQECWIRFGHKTWRRKGSDDARHALYVYYVGDTVTDSPLVYRPPPAGGGHGSAQRSGLIGFRLRGDLPAGRFCAEPCGQLMAELQQVGRGDTGEAGLPVRRPGPGRPRRFRGKSPRSACITHRPVRDRCNTDHANGAAPLGCIPEGSTRPVRFRQRVLSDIAHCSIGALHSCRLDVSPIRQLELRQRDNATVPAM